jgi:phosphate transport system permease protein
MQSFILLATLLILCIVGFYLGRARAVSTVGGQRSRLHSLPSYHGLYVALWCGIPSLLLFVVWLIVEPHVIETIALNSLPAGRTDLPDAELGLLLNDIRNLASGDAISTTAALPAPFARETRSNAH